MASKMLDAMRDLPGAFPELTEFLLQQGADPNHWDANLSPLHAALKRGDILSAEMLIKAGSDCNALTGASHGSYTPVILLMHVKSIDKADKEDLLKLMIAHKANPDYERIMGSALHFAVLRDLPGCIEILLGHGVSQRHAVMEAGRGTPLELAERLGHTHLAELMMTR